MPNSGLNCVLAILMDAAAVKPVITGNEMKSNRKPKCSKPSSAMMQPLKKVSSTTMSAPYLSTRGLTIVAMIAVGPIVILLQEPKIMYTNDAMNDAYNPYSGLNPATIPYAIPCGIAVSPTVKPANISWGSQVIL